MTIGIACHGNNAVEAAISAVLGAELLGRGAIGGFAVLAILDENGAFQHVCVQRGGVSELQVPDQWCLAKTAAIISSGPDRPEPLVQFLPGKSGIALVTGHRVPTSLTRSGIPANEAVLQLLAEGRLPQAAIDDVLCQEPEMDAGLIVLTANGKIGWANTQRVARRPDIGDAAKVEDSCGYALLHNSIYSNHSSCAELARSLGDLAWAALSDTEQVHGLVRLVQPIVLQLADSDRVTISADGCILALETANRALLSGHYALRSVVYGAPQVFCDGHLVGYAATELFARIDEGVAYPFERMADRTMIIKRSVAIQA